MGSDEIDLTVPDLAELQRRRSQKWSGHAPGVLASTIAEMDFPIAAPIADALRETVDRGDLGYASVAPASLREAFIGFAKRRLSWSVDPDQVVLLPDVMAGLIELCRVVAEPDTEVVFAGPAYPPFFEELPYAGVRTRTVPVDADGAIELGSLRRAFADGARVMVLTNPHNPTGRVLPRAELERIAALCAEFGVWVLADEIHAPLVLAGAEHVPWLEVSDAARSRGVALTSASKAFNLAGLKAALLVTASDKARQAVGKLPPTHERAGLLGVIAAEVAFTAADPWLDAVLRQLDANRTLLAGLLATNLPAIRWRPPQGTYLAWLDCTALNLGDDPATAFRTQGQVALARGLDFGAEGAGHVRLNFATGPGHLTELVRRMTSTVS